MAERPQTIVLCSCDDTMPLDAGAVRRGCRGAKVEIAGQLCRAEIERFRAAVAAGAPLTIGCTQEAPLFAEVAQESKKEADLTFVNVRETAGWSSQAADAGPKMAALLAAAGEPMPKVPFVTLTSDGVILIYGRDEQAIEAANLLKDHLDVTVMITKPAALTPGRVNEFPVVKGTIRSAKGHLGAFEIVVDDFAAAAPSSRGALAFGPGRDGAVSHCDIMLDISGSAPLFSAHDLRDGYLRADPGDPAAVLRAVIKARDLVGTFDKPRYIAFSEDLCAHSRSRIVGCRRCLDLCPTGAIEPAGDHVAIDANICAGCGQCAAVCPTGAAAYALPPTDALMRKLRTLLTVYREAGGSHPIVLLHDDEHGGALIDALARHGDGLPANVLPLVVNEVTQVGLETIAAAFAYGASAVRFLLRGQAAPRHCRTDQDRRSCRADSHRARLRLGGDHRDRRSRRTRCGVGCNRSARVLAAPGELFARGAKARSDAARVARIARRGAHPDRCRRAAGRRAIRCGRDRRRRLHALPVVRRRLSDRRARRRSGAPAAALHRGCLRAVRAVQGDLPGEGDHTQAAARLPRRHRHVPRAQGGRAVPLHSLRQAVRRQEHNRACDRQARGPALDVCTRLEAARCAQDVRGLPRRGRDRG